MTPEFERAIRVQRVLPGLEQRPWGWGALGIGDPFGHRLVFSERISDG